MVKLETVKREVHIAMQLIKRQSESGGQDKVYIKVNLSIDAPENSYFLGISCPASDSSSEIIGKLQSDS